MTKNDFIQLLEQYRNKALEALRNEAKVAANFMITDEFRARAAKLEEMAAPFNEELRVFCSQFEGILKANALDTKYHYFNPKHAETKLLETAVLKITNQITCSKAYENKKREIENKFDAVIRSAKSTKSAEKLKKLAEALGIEVESIEVDGDVSTGVDAPFLKEKIQAVKLLA